MTLFGGQRTVKVGLEIDPKGVGAGLAVAKKQIGDWARAADQSLAKHRRNWDEIGDAAAKAGLVIGGGVAAAVVKFAQFDKSMSRAAAGTQATSREMEQLRQAAVTAGQQTQYSATEAADAITAMGKAGVSVKDILGGGLSGALSLAASGELAVGDAAEIAATAMTQFGLTGRDLPHVADLLAAGAGKAQGSVGDLANALKYVGPVAKSAGVPIEETVGVLAELASQGIISEQAGTSLRGVLQSLRSPSKTAAAAMREYSIEVYDANGKFVGLSTIAQQLQQHLGGLSQAQRDAALGAIFGNEQITAATILMQGGGRAVDEWTKKVNDSGFSARQAGELMNNLAGDVEQLKGSLETALIQSGSGANSGLRSLAQGATAAVNAFSSLPAGVQRSTVVVAGLTAGALLLTAGVIKGALAVKTMRTNLDELGVAGARTKGALAALGKVGGAVAAVQVIGAVTDSFRSSAVPVNTATKELLQYVETGKSASDLTGKLGMDLSRMDDGFAGIGKAQRAVAGLFGGILEMGGDDSISRTAERLQSLDAALAGMVSSGNAKSAGAFVAKVAADNGRSIDEIISRFPQYKDALDGATAAEKDAGSEAGKAASKTDDLGGSMGTAAYKAGQMAEKLKDVRDAAKDLNRAFLDERSAARDYQQALDDAAERLADRGKASKRVAEAQSDLRKAKTPDQRKRAKDDLDEALKAQRDLAAGMDESTKAGRDNQEVLDGIARSAQKQADTILATTGSDEAYRASLAKSRSDLFDMARKFGLARDAAQQLTDKILAMPQPAPIDLQVKGLEEAKAKVQEMVGVIAWVNGKRAVVAVEASSPNVREGRSALAPVAGPPAIPPRVTSPNEREGHLPARGGGGPVVAGRPYMVGEYGPERFVPWSDGNIMPNQGGARVVTVPVQSTHTREQSVNLNGPVTVVARNPREFAGWAGGQGAFGSGGVS